MNQYAALYHLRHIKQCDVDDSQIIHALTYSELHDEQFVDASFADATRLVFIVRALSNLAFQRTVPSGLMLHALSHDEHSDYLQSFNISISHIEDEAPEGMPDKLRQYAQLVRQGDRYEALANRFMRSRTTKRDARGRTASARLRGQAETSYESAGVYLHDLLDGLPGMPFDAELAYHVQQWLDRPVSVAQGQEPSTDCVGIARIRGSKSKYSLSVTQPMSTIRLRKYWRQREALVLATLPMLYGVTEIQSQSITSSNELTEKLQKLLLTSKH